MGWDVVAKSDTENKDLQKATLREIIKPRRSKWRVPVQKFLDDFLNQRSFWVQTGSLPGLQGGSAERKKGCAHELQGLKTQARGTSLLPMSQCIPQRTKTYIISTLGHWGPAAIICRLVIILGLIMDVMVKHTQRSSLTTTAEGPAVTERETPF